MSHAPVILIHGAANSAGVWRFWQHELAKHGWRSEAIDLRGHGRAAPLDLSSTSMANYAADVAARVAEQPTHPILVGWSMGGLVALMVAATGAARACVGLAPSAPARSIDPSIALQTGEFGPEEYGIVGRDPAQQPAMPDLDREERLIALGSLGRESRLARSERQRGIVITDMPCPLLIVTGTRDTDWPRDRYADLHLSATHLRVEGASHWGLVLNRRVLPGLVARVAQWMETGTMAAAHESDGPADGDPARPAGSG